MGKTVGIILTTLGSAALIATGVGAVGGIALFGSTSGITVAGATLGQLAFASSALTGLGTMVGGGAGAPKTNTSSTSIKISRPDRKAGYGESRLYGAYILYETGSNGAAIDGFAVHDGRMTSPVAFYLGDDKVTHQAGVTYPGGLINGLSDGRYSDDTTRFYWTDGRAPGTTIPLIITDLPGVWSSNHRGDDVCLIYTRFASVKSKNFLTRYPSGVPTASIAAKWQKCPDPWAADPCDDTAWSWTENPVRQMMHYMLYREAPKPTIPHDDPAYYAQMLAMRVAYYNRKIAPSIASWRAASDVCDEPIALKAGGTEARYRSCLSHSLTTSHAEVKAGLLALCDGWMATQSDGSVAIHAGKLQTPTVTISDEHIIAYEWEGVGVDDDQAINELVCSYVSTAHDYNSVECDAWRDETDILERGALLSDSLDLQTPSWGQVRRIAKRRMGRTNALFRGVVTTNIAGRIARGQRYINLHLAEAGTVFFDGVAEITGVTRNSATGGITFSWVAVDANADAWNPATEEGEPAAVGDRVALTPLPTPTITTATAELGDGGSTARVRITVDGFDRDDITWFARWRITSDTTWNEQEYSDIDPGPSAVLLTSFVALDVAIDVQVAYSVGDGRVSPWSALESVSTSTAGLAPSPPTMLAFTGETIDTVSLEARAPLGPNFDYLRFYADVDGTFAGAVDISGNIVVAPGAIASYTETDIEAGPRYYWAQAFNATGSPSAETGPILASVGAFVLTGGALPTGATLTRASAGYYRNASGVWTSAATDVARFDHRWNGSAWVASGLLVEAAATNLALQSLDLTAAVWTKSGVTASAGRLTETAALSDHRASQAVSYTSGSSYCLSAEAVEVSGSPKRYLTLLLDPAAFGGVNRYAKFDLEAGAVTYVAGGATAGIEAAGPGKWLCWISSTATATASAVAQVRLGNTSGSSIANYTGDIAAAIDVSEFQTEVGTRPTSRIPTTTTTVARAADIVTLDWAGRNVADGSINVLYTFGNGATQAGTMTVASGVANIPTPLNRSAVARIDRT